MGMVTVLRRADDHIIAQLLANPKLIHQALDEEGASDGAPTASPSFLERLLGKRALPKLILQREPEDEVDLDKAWNAIHFMLTGTADDTSHPLGFIFSGGETVGDEEVGYGPARVFTSSATRRIADQIKSITRSDFLERYNAPAMLAAKVYPEPLWEPNRADEHNEEYVADNFELLREFLSAASASGKGFIIFLT